MSLIKKLFLIVLLAALLFGAFLLSKQTNRTKLREYITVAYAHASSESNSAYPDVETRNLTKVQRDIVVLTHKEYAARPVSYDKSVLKYTDGNKEPWCADFTSWIMRQAGAPYKNPNSGTWRIPGVLTLKEYYEAEGRYIKVNDSYVPKIGDVAIYSGDNTLEGNKGQHVNIVIAIMGDTMTTIGGNERGRMRISKVNFKAREKSLIGYGTLPQDQEKMR